MVTSGSAKALSFGEKGAERGEARDRHSGARLVMTDVWKRVGSFQPIPLVEPVHT